MFSHCHRLLKMQRLAKTILAPSDLVANATFDPVTVLQHDHAMGTNVGRSKINWYKETFGDIWQWFKYRSRLAVLDMKNEDHILHIRAIARQFETERINNKSSKAATIQKRKGNTQRTRNSKTTNTHIHSRTIDVPSAHRYFSSRRTHTLHKPVETKRKQNISLQTAKFSHYLSHNPS